MAGVKMSELTKVAKIAAGDDADFLVRTADGSRVITFDALVTSLSGLISGGESTGSFGQSLLADRRRFIQGYDALVAANLPEYDTSYVSSLTSLHFDEFYAKINNLWIHFDEQTISFTTGSVGYNYYIHAHSAGTITIDSVKVTDDSSQVCIGGFHYGRVRKSTTVADVVDGGIVPNSIWNELWRPDCPNPDAMVYIGRRMWGDIYLTRCKTSADSNSEGGEVYDSSAYGAYPCTGTENFSQYTFTEALAKVGKRLSSSDEFVAAADGSPEGLDSSNSNAWSATSNTARATCGAVTNAISSVNVVDLVGNVWKWNRDKYDRNGGGTSYGWNSLGGTKGDVYAGTSNGLGALRSGGVWFYGAHDGSRCVSTDASPWGVHTHYGAWGVADLRS